VVHAHKVAVFECAFPAISIVTATAVVHEVTAFGLAATTAFNAFTSAVL
jgi:hypothetical protein